MSVREDIHRLVDTLDDDEAAVLLSHLQLLAELDHADKQLSSGEFADYNEKTIQNLTDGVKNRGRARLAVCSAPTSPSRAGR